MNFEENKPVSVGDVFSFEEKNAEDAYDWAIARSIPIFGEITSSSWNLITKTGPIVIAGLFPEGGPTHKAYLLNLQTIHHLRFKETMKTTAISKKGKYRFVWIDAVKHNAVSFLLYLTISGYKEHSTSTNFLNFGSLTKRKIYISFIARETAQL